MIIVLERCSCPASDAASVRALLPVITRLVPRVYSKTRFRPVDRDRLQIIIDGQLLRHECYRRDELNVSDFQELMHLLFVKSFFVL